MNSIDELIKKKKKKRITPNKETKELLKRLNTSILNEGSSLYEFLKRPEISIDDLSIFIDLDYSTDVKEEVEIIVKYEGYIKKANKEAEKMLSLESKGIPEDIDYDDIANLASEAREKLKEIRPLSIGQATRISGVNPADISILMVYLRRKYNDR